MFTLCQRIELYWIDTRCTCICYNLHRSLFNVFMLHKIENHLEDSRQKLRSKTEIALKSLFQQFHSNSNTYSNVVRILNIQTIITFWKFSAEKSKINDWFSKYSSKYIYVSHMKVWGLFSTIKTPLFIHSNNFYFLYNYELTFESVWIYRGRRLLSSIPIYRNVTALKDL